MEFPDLGAHCHEKTCNRLDFLPMKCDACSFIFCNNHIQYSQHACEKLYERDVQVPVCPLCNNPVPTKRGQLPDLEVEQHILRDCLADPAVNKRKIYTNKCYMKNCKQKELIPFTCPSCGNNYCVKHRHTADHNCSDLANGTRQLSQAGAAALARAQNFPGSSIFRRNPTPQQNGNAINRFQAGMTEDEALALAMQQSLMDAGPNSTSTPKSLQETEDRLLAEALAASEREVTCRGAARNKRCVIS